MLASSLKNALIQHGSVSLQQLSLELKHDVDDLRRLLQQWVVRGRVKCFRATSACQTKCNRCEFAQTEMYQWLEH